MSFVYDSSAMLAFLNEESGGDVVTQLLASDVPHHAHAVNLCEVFYDVHRRVSVARADEEIQLLKAAGIIECHDMDGVFWRDVAALVARFRSGKGKRLALGDAFGVALARRLDADFVTADRGELEAVSQAGECRIVFIR